jgi:DNA repair exonuclease SbcCD ATPase subunit
MRPFRLLAVLLPVLISLPLHAQQFANTCHASSSYDVTLRTDSLLFDRAAPAPSRVEIRQGALRTDGMPVQLNAEDQDRLSLFEREARELAPRVRAVAQNGVDMAAQALRAEAGGMGMSADTRAEFDRRLAADASELKQRIEASRSTRDWQGDVGEQYANRIIADLMPLLAADLGQQAMNAALSGDLQAAANLRDRATSLATELQPRLQRRMQALQPQVEALCPAIRRLAELQQGVRGSNGQPLNLLQIGQ